MTAGNVALTAHIAKKQQHKLPGAARGGVAHRRDLRVRELSGLRVTLMRAVLVDALRQKIESLHHH